MYIIQILDAMHQSYDALSILEIGDELNKLWFKMNFKYQTWYVLFGQQRLMRNEAMQEVLLEGVSMTSYFSSFPIASRSTSFEICLLHPGCHI